MAGFGTGSKPKELALVVDANEAWLLNARVRDLLEDTDLPHLAADTDVQVQLERALSDPRPLALGIVRALHDLRTIKETSIMVSEEECWFLERRFRHDDREIPARALIPKVHDLLMEFHSDLVVDLGLPEAEESADDRTYEQTQPEQPDEGANEDPNPNAESDPGTEPGPTAQSLPTE